MNFKLWLEADETHPFEAWHKEYEDSREAERKHWDGFDYRRYRNLPHPPEPKVSTAILRKDPRTKNLSVVDVLTLYNYTSGWHSFGDQSDVPASDPAHGAKWEVKIKAQQEKILSGKTAFVVDSSGGSYHERWLRMKVCVIVNDIVNQEGYYDTPDDEKLEWYTFSDTYGSSLTDIVKVFKFQSLQQAAAVVEELEPNLPPPGEEGESREDYWKRIMGTQTPPPDPTGYNPSDDYYKRSG